jgi:hypothetical protein
MVGLRCSVGCSSREAPPWCSAPSWHSDAPSPARGCDFRGPIAAARCADGVRGLARAGLAPTGHRSLPCDGRVSIGCELGRARVAGGSGDSAGLARVRPRRGSGARSCCGVHHRSSRRGLGQALVALRCPTLGGAGGGGCTVVAECDRAVGRRSCAAVESTERLVRLEAQAPSSLLNRASPRGA